MQKALLKTSFRGVFYSSALLALFLVPQTLFASGYQTQSLGDIAGNIILSMNNLAKLISAASYVVGVGFALMGMLKFKAHKDNPTQVQLSQPIVLLAIAAGLVYLPSLISTVGNTAWGTNAHYANAQGTGLLGTNS